MRARGTAAALPLLLAMACETLPQDKQSPAPLNACPAHPCTAYEQSSPSVCTGGMCAASELPPALYVVISLPTYSRPGPSMTFVLTAYGEPPKSALCDDSLDSCDETTCQLPRWITDTDAYQVLPAASAPAEANFNLGNQGRVSSLPSSATYRLLVGPELDDALDVVGLPVLPAVSQSFRASGVNGDSPQMGDPFWYLAAMPPGCYRRTVQPYAPLSSAFPPEIKVWQPGDSAVPISGFDQTTEEIGPSSSILPYPTFDLSRAEGLDGWTAYLRSAKTGQVTSIVASLHGSLDKGVRLLTNHGGDVDVVDMTTGLPEALAGLELVIAPPPGTPLPTEVLSPLGPKSKPELPAAETYPSLPTPVQVTGRIETTAGVPVPAQVVFKAVDVFNRAGTPFPSTNFEFTTTVATAADARTGAAVYSAVVPRGDYQIVVRPTGGSSSAITVIGRTIRASADAVQDIEVLPKAQVTGQAVLADGREVAEGLVEAIPAACPLPASAAPSAAASTDEACLPSLAQFVARDDGTFSLSLDPGSYALRVTPVQGTRFPWVSQSLVVGTESMALPRITIPAPVVFSRTVTSGVGAAINAVVRVFNQPTSGSRAVELGRAFTDSSGHFDVYLAVPSP